MEMERSQRGRSSKTVESSTNVGEDVATDYAQRTSPGELNGEERAPDAQGQEARALEGVAAGDDGERTDNPVASLVETTTEDDVAEGSSSRATRVIEIDADDWIDKDLEALSATDPSKVGVGTAPGAVPSVTTRRFPYLDLRLDERLGRVLLAIVLAVLLSFYVFNVQNPPKAVPFPGITIEVRHAAPQLKVINPIPIVNVTVQGPQSVLNTVTKSDIHAYVDLAGISEGVHEVRIDADIDSGKKSELSIVLSPSTIQMQLELQVTRVFTVAAQVNGTPAVGYTLESTQVTPDQVRVTGLKEAVSRIAKIVVPVDVEGRASTLQGAAKTPVALDANDQPIKDLVFEPPTLQVEARLRLLSNYRIVPVKPSLVGQPAPSYQVSSITITPTNVTVVTACCPAALEQLAFLETGPISITGTTTTVITSIKLLLPEGIGLYFDQPKQITVTVSVQPIQTTLKLSVVPTVEGVAPGYNAVVSPSQMDLTLSGTFSQLQGLSPAAIRATINAEGRDAGTYTVKPQIVVPQGVKLEGSTPDQLTLTLLAPTPSPTRTPVAQSPQATATSTVEVVTSVTPVTTRAATTVPTSITPAVVTATPTQPSAVATVTPTAQSQPQTTHTPEGQVTPTSTVGQP